MKSISEELRGPVCRPKYEIHIQLIQLFINYTVYQNHISDISRLKRSQVDNLHTPNCLRANILQQNRGII